MNWLLLDSLLIVVGIFVGMVQLWDDHDDDDAINFCLQFIYNQKN